MFWPFGRHSIGETGGDTEIKAETFLNFKLLRLKCLCRNQFKKILLLTLWKIIQKDRFREWLFLPFGDAPLGLDFKDIDSQKYPFKGETFFFSMVPPSPPNQLWKILILIFSGKKNIALADNFASTEDDLSAVITFFTVIYSQLKLLLK